MQTQDKLQSNTKQPKAKVQLITSSLLSQIKKPSYQRPINPDRIPEIKTAVAGGVWVPPVTLAETDGELYIMDGQHRLEARRQMDFELLAVIVPMSRDVAIKNFLITNTSSRKVSLKHRLSVDPSEPARKVRDLAKEFEASPQQVYAVLSGLFGINGSDYNSVISRDSKGTAFNLEKTREFLAYWTKDTRWNGGGKTIYDKPMVLRLVSNLASREKDWMGAVRKMRNGLDFTMESTLGRKRSGHGSGIVTRNMRDFIMEQFFLGKAN